VPTFKEAGVKDIDAVFNIGLVAPAGTPAAIVEKIAADVRRILMDPEFRKTNVDAYSYVAVASTPPNTRPSWPATSRCRANA
jgi:tripartite-type tricarboxylate transporter receptor subunit TctC